MATISPAPDKSFVEATRIVWEAAAAGDTINHYTPAWPGLALSSIHMAGTWGGATVTMKYSNDLTKSWLTMVDKYGANVSATEDAIFEVDTTALHIKFTIAGGSGNDVDVIVGQR